MQTASVTADPLHPGTVYANAANNTNSVIGIPDASTGIYKSTDCGAHWTQASTNGQNSDAINAGLIWEEKFDPSGSNLYVANGYVGTSSALFKSSDGNNWTNLFAGKSFTLSGDTKVNGPVPASTVFQYLGFVEAFSIDPDPTQNHIVVTFHEPCFDGVSAAQGGWGLLNVDSGVLCLGESTDGGTTWRLFLGYDANGGSAEAATVSILGPTTYLYISPSGVYYTGDAGQSWQPVQFTNDNGVTWQATGPAYSAYGGGTYIASDGTLYLGTSGNGILYSKATPSKVRGSPQNWAQLTGSPQNVGIINSDDVSLFASWGIFDNSGQPIYSAPLSTPTSWSNSRVPTNITNGVNGFAYDSVNHILYAACYSGGLLRMATP